MKKTQETTQSLSDEQFADMYNEYQDYVAWQREQQAKEETDNLFGVQQKIMILKMLETEIITYNNTVNAFIL